jgi:putative oxidoreductase
LAAWLDRMNPIIPPLFLRLMLSYEFGEAGYAKLYGENWFADVSFPFPFPFGMFSPEFNWRLATIFELLGALGLLLGLATRFFSFALVVITFMAIASVHWPSEWSSIEELFRGYSISDNGYGNYKLPLIYLVMLLPLLLGGAGKFSLDFWLEHFPFWCTANRVENDRGE